MSLPAHSNPGIYSLSQEWPNTCSFHLVGIGGISMSGLAEILLRLGFEVSGSDLSRSKLTDRLESLGATVYEGHDALNITDVDVVVYSAAVKDNNPELISARERGILILSRGDLLAGMIRQGKGIAVAGTHGKSTTTTMIGLMLLDCGHDPTLIVGGVVPVLGSNIKMGEGDHIVVEADEYSRSFLQLSPEIAVLTSIDADHLEYFGGQEAI
ncbi:MAG: Mur ligase domain-containing protein, partial [Gammaproteobacteria bacterium]|nr:Mur ligase domain-containing protein [Gammaproteobacteria bacterium]